MKLASAAPAAGLSTGALHVDQAATQERVFMNDLSEAGAGSAFRIGQAGSGFHGASLTDIIKYIRIDGLVKQILECEFAQGRKFGVNSWNLRRLLIHKKTIYGTAEANRFVGVSADSEL